MIIRNINEPKKISKYQLLKETDTMTRDTTRVLIPVINAVFILLVMKYCKLRRNIKV